MENKKDGLSSLKNILKNITIEKWLLIGGAGIVLILCSDSCSGKKAENKDDIMEERTAEETGESLSSEDYVDALEEKLENLRIFCGEAGNRDSVFSDGKPAGVAFRYKLWYFI